ncbi:15365_t:CDS:1 [Acaulospora colombiana]|uniref:15365_t:CDS:1 n=1 Tax=Acaulospora colombiana TaxID=27376 RepID=A0ACA9MQ86_9GLOM|nr:15365_t:CDS:1 [Acaulospora colombiana]
MEGNVSTPKEWLFAQLQMNDSEIREILGHEDYSICTATALIEVINDCLNISSLTLVFDEAQFLCRPEYGEYIGGSVAVKKWNLLQAYIEYLTHFPVTCLLVSAYMNIASEISPSPSIGKFHGLGAHIVLKLPFLSQDDVLRNLDAVIDLTDVSPKTRDYLGCILRGRPRNCASFVRMLVSERESKNRTKDQEILELLDSWSKKLSFDVATYLENVCKWLKANNFNPETAIMDVLRLHVFYNYKFKQAIELLQHSIIPYQSPKYIILDRNVTLPDEIEINPLLESYLVSGIEVFLLKRGKTLVDVFVDNIIRLNNISSIGNEFNAVLTTEIIQKRGRNVREELNKWKNGQQFNLPSWITPTMKFTTISNLSGGVPIAKYVDNMDYYCHYAIQPDRYSGPDVVISLNDDEQNMILLSASCIISEKPIERSKIKEQLFRSCMKFQYMEIRKKNKRKSPQVEDLEEFSWKEPERLQIGLDKILPFHEESISVEKEEEYNNKDLNLDDLNYDLNYIENTKNYGVSKVSEHAKNHEQIKIATENRKHIYVSVELPHRASKRPELFRFNEYGDLVIIVDDRNMEYVFGPVIKEPAENLTH